MNVGGRGVVVVGEYSQISCASVVSIVFDYWQQLSEEYSVYRYIYIYKIPGILILKHANIECFAA